MAIKLIALDLDGTTLNSEGKLTLFTEETLNKASLEGIHIVIATGRSRATLPEEIFKVAGIEYVITSNGAVITNLRKEELVYENYIQAKALEDICKLLSQHELRKHKFMVEVFLKGKPYVEKHIFENLERIGLSESSIKYVRRTREPYINVSNLMVKNKEHIENININFGRQQDKEIMREKLMLLKDVTITSSFDHNLEIGGATTSKASALIELCDKLGVNVEQVMACGDSPNDEAMMKVAGLPIAMGNAKPSVKAMAKYVTGTNDEDGVAKAINKFILK